MRSLKTQTTVQPHEIIPNKSVRLPVLLQDGTLRPRRLSDSACQNTGFPVNSEFQVNNE